MRRLSIMAGLVIAIVIGLLLVSCSTAPSSPDTSQGTAAGAKPYGSLNVATRFLNDSMDPQTSSPSTWQEFDAGIFDSLIELTAEGKPRPGIAERWEISDDGLVQTFYIRKEVKFQNGDDLTAADVKFSIERFIAPESVHLDAAGWRSQIARVELKDDYTVVLLLKQPQYELLIGFETVRGGPAVLPMKYIQEKGVDYFRKNPVGSGPWKVLKYVPGNSLELEAMDSHWRAVPKFKNVTQLNVSEESTKIAMLKTGELDIAEISPDSTAGVKSAGLKILQHKGGSEFFFWLLWDMNKPEKYAMGDVRVRKALSLMINRQEMGDKLFSGYAQPKALRAVPRTAYFWDPNVLKPDPYDPDQAKRLLLEAGYPDGFDTKITDVGGGNIVSIVDQAMAGYWRKLGVKVDVVSKDYPTLLPQMRSQAPETFNTVFVMSAGGVFQFEAMAQTYHSQKSTAKNIRNPKLDELIDKVPLTKDPAEKKKMALEAAVLAQSAYAIVSLLEADTLFAYGSKVGGFTPTVGTPGLAASLDTIAHPK